MEYIQERKNDVSELVHDVLDLFSTNERTLTEDQLRTIQDFSTSCKAHIKKGRVILYSIPPTNLDGFYDVKSIFNQMEHQLDQLDKIVNAKIELNNLSSRFNIDGGILGGAAGIVISGGTNSFLIDAPYCGFDVGLMTALGAIIGALVGETDNETYEVSNETKYLLPILSCLVENIEKLVVAMRITYGQLSAPS